MYTAASYYFYFQIILFVSTSGLDIYITDEKIESGTTCRHAHSQFDAPFDLTCGRSCAQKFRMKEGLKRERNFL